MNQSVLAKETHATVRVCIHVCVLCFNANLKKERERFESESSSKIQRVSIYMRMIIDVCSLSLSHPFVYVVVVVCIIFYFLNRTFSLFDFYLNFGSIKCVCESQISLQVISLFFF